MPPKNKDKKTKSKKQEILIREGTQAERAKIAAAIVNKEMGEDVVLMAGDKSFNMFRFRRPFGILGLDVATGGGLPAGGLSEIIGLDGVGKTTICNVLIAENQRLYGENSAVFYDAVELAMDKDHARKTGVQIAHSKEEIDQSARINGLKFSKDEIKQLQSEKIGEVIEVRASTAEQHLEAVLKLVKSNQFQIGIIDSIGGLLPEATEEDPMDKKHYGGAAAVITTFCQKLSSILNRKDEYGRPNQTTLVAINQVRDRIGGMPTFGEVFKIGGGKALRHQKLIDIELRLAETIKDESKKTIAKLIKWKITKGKAGAHDGPVGTYRYDLLDRRIGLAKASFDAALDYGVIEKHGSYYHLWDQQFQGAAPTLEFLASAEVRDKLRDQVFEVVGIKALIGEE